MKAGKVLKSTFLKLTVISIIAFALMSGKTAQAAGTIQVESLDEFFDKLSEQIYDRDAYRYYSTSNTDVSSEFVNFKMLDYQMHYREGQAVPQRMLSVLLRKDTSFINLKAGNKGTHRASLYKRRDGRTFRKA